MSAAPRVRSRTLPLTCTTIVTVSTASHRRVGHRPRLSWTCAPSWRRCPQLGGDVRRHRRQQQQQRVDGEVGVRALACTSRLVNSMNDGDRGVVRPSLELVGDADDQPVRGARSTCVGGVAVGAGIAPVGCRVGEAPQAVQEAGACPRCRRRPSRRRRRAARRRGGTAAGRRRRRCRWYSSGVTRLPLDFDILRRPGGSCPG